MSPKDKVALSAGGADDIAAAILSCATHLRFSTGTTITVDGGRSL